MMPIESRPTKGQFVIKFHFFAHFKQIADKINFKD